MELAVDFLHVNFVAQYSHARVMPPKIVDHVEELEHDVTESDVQEFVFSDSLAGRLAFFPVKRNVRGDPPLGNDAATLVNGELVLASHGVYLCLSHILNGFSCESDAVAYFDILGHQLCHHWTVFVAQS